MEKPCVLYNFKALRLLMQGIQVFFLQLVSHIFQTEPFKEKYGQNKYKLKIRNNMSIIHFSYLVLILFGLN